MTRFAIALTALVLALAACGSESDTPAGQGDRSGAGAGTEKPEEESAAPTGGAAVRMVGIQYEPRELTVKAGTTVTFTNEDAAPHDVDATSGSDFKSEVVQQGGTIELPTEEPGTIEFFCSVHPNMTGKITVTG